MKKVFLLLLFVIPFACTTDQMEVVPVTQEVTVEKTTPYKQIDYWITKHEAYDLNQRFILHLASAKFAHENINVQVPDVTSFFNKYENASFETVLAELETVFSLENQDIALLSSVQQDMLSLPTADDRVKYIENVLSDYQNSTKLTAALVEGYQNILLRRLSNVEARNCISNCVLANKYGSLWWFWHNQGVENAPPAYCPFPPNILCSYAVSYANASLTQWCQNRCAVGGGDDEPSDPCEGVHCIPGWDCVDGDCVFNPDFPDLDCINNKQCPPGEICLNNRCIPL